MEELYEKNRNQMIENCGIALFLFGNKKDNERSQQRLFDKIRLITEYRVKNIHQQKIISNE